MSLLILVVAVLLLLPGTGATSPGAGPADTLRRGEAGSSQQVSDVNQLEQARQLYLMNCASCHGIVGEGSDYAPDIRNVGEAGNDFFMRTGRMPPGRLGVPTWDQQPQLSEAQIQAIVAYASSFGEGPQIPQVVAELGDIQRGWRLYINNCAACHGATGGGGGIGGGVIAPPLHAADPLIVAEAMVVGPGPMPRFIFPDDDVNAIAAYVEFLRAEAAPGGIDLAGGPVPEGAIAALLGVGLLVLIVRWIARRAEFEPAPEQENRQ